MSNIWLEIQRMSGVDRRAVHSDGGLCATAEGACPGCGAEPFLIQGTGRHRFNRDTYKAGGVSKCCSQNVGWIFAKVDTLFGIEEDEAVGARARVYRPESTTPLAAMRGGQQ